MRMTVATADQLLVFRGLGRVKILSTRGALVKELDMGLLSGGRAYPIVWDAKDQGAALAAPGLYQAVFWMPGFSRTAAKGRQSCAGICVQAGAHLADQAQREREHRHGGSLTREVEGSCRNYDGIARLGFIDR